MSQSAKSEVRRAKSLWGTAAALPSCLRAFAATLFAARRGDPYDRLIMTLRVVQVVADDPARGASRSVLVRGLARALAQRGHASAVIHPRYTSACEPFGLEVPGDAPARAVEAADAVHLHGWDATLRAWARAARTAGRRLIVSPAGGLSPRRFDRPRLTERLRRWLADPGLLKSATLLAQNPPEADELRRAGPRVEVLGYGIDFDAADDAPPAGDSPLMLVLGPVHPGWGLVPLLKALAELDRHAARWRLVLAGPPVGAWKRMIEAALHRKQAADRVRFENPDAAGVRALLRQAALLVAPAVEVVPPTPVLLGLAAGLCVLASPAIVPAGAEACVELCEPRRSALRQALEPLVSQPVERLRGQGRAMREKAEACCGWAGLVERYERLYAGAG